MDLVFIVGAVVLIACVVAAYATDERNKRSELRRQHELFEGQRLVEERIRGERLQVEMIVRECVAPHLKVLGRKYRQMRKADDYGNALTAEWDREVQYFLSTVMRDASIGEYRALAVDVLTDIAGTEATRQATEVGRLANVGELLPSEFEIECAEELRRHGWDATAVGISGDQGSDVLASRGGVSVVLQCKLYSSPVGNGAVQEVFAARQHFGADVACVVTNTSYTKSAKDLAATTGVLLLHHDQLRELDRLLGLQPG